MNEPRDTVATTVMPAASGIVHVTTDSQLPGALELLAQGNYLALDTEFLRESTYYAKLCLVQLGNEHACVVVDVLALDNLTTLLDFILDRSRIKIFHAARQDLEVLTQAQATNPQVPGPLFDTQIAAGLLGLPGQIGYGDLLSHRLDIQLEKGLARTDWSRRPLSQEQLHYAADDVRYLGPLYQQLKNALQQRARYTWLEEETAALENLALYRTVPEDAWQRLKGTAQLQPEQRAVLKQLATWREGRAIQSDKPRGWILSDEALRNICERLPTTLDELSQTRNLPAGVVRKHGDMLLSLITEAQQQASNEAPARDFRPSNQQQSQVSKLMQLVRSTAEKIEVSSELLATRRDAEQLVYFKKCEVLLQGWRKDVIGEALIAAHKAQS
ncbi:MAG: ribonuclease D [Steroidobacteraceae bacterium]